MKGKLISLVLITVATAVAVSGYARGQEEDETFAKKVRDFFVATPTPAPRKHPKKSTPAPKRKSPTPSRTRKSTPQPSATPFPSPEETPAPEPSATATPIAETPSPTPSPYRHQTPAEEVRPIQRAPNSPSPVIEATPEPTAERRPTIMPSLPPLEVQPTASPTPSPTPEQMLTPTARETTKPLSPSPTPEKKASVSPSPKKSRPAVATVSPDRLIDYEKYPEAVRKIVDLGLSLTTQDLKYKYGSADPAGGGMDCSGFVYYVLQKNGIQDVPRDAREQYVWVRKAGNFRAVLGHGDDTFELDELKPGDLLFWSGAYTTAREPDVTHTMIYLGREKGTNQRIMMGANDGRIFKGASRNGVGVFDFRLGRAPAKKSDEAPPPVFMGYGRIPGLPKD